MWCFLILLIKITNVVSNYPQLFPCKCDGTEFHLSSRLFTANACGRWAMCAWDIWYYLENKKGSVVPPELSLSQKSQYEALYKKIMSWFGYPYLTSLEPHIKECRVGLRACGKEKTKLLESECKRLSLLPPVTETWEERFKKFKITPYKFGDFWTIFGDSNKVNKKDRYSFSNHAKYFTITCPMYVRYPGLTFASLLNSEGVRFYDGISLQSLARAIKPGTVRALWCDFVFSVTHTYYKPYNHTDFCQVWHYMGAHLCFHLDNEYGLEQRDVKKECRTPPLPPRSEQARDVLHEPMNQGPHGILFDFASDYSD